MTDLDAPGSSYSEPKQQSTVEGIAETYSRRSATLNETFLEQLGSIVYFVPYWNPLSSSLKSICGIHCVLRSRLPPSSGPVSFLLAESLPSPSCKYFTGTFLPARSSAPRFGRHSFHGLKSSADVRSILGWRQATGVHGFGQGLSSCDGRLRSDVRKRRKWGAFGGWSEVPALAPCMHKASLAPTGPRARNVLKFEHWRDQSSSRTVYTIRITGVAWFHCMSEPRQDILRVRARSVMHKILL